RQRQHPGQVGGRQRGVLQKGRPGVDERVGGGSRSAGQVGAHARQQQAARQFLAGFPAGKGVGVATRQQRQLGVGARVFNYDRRREVAQQRQHGPFFHATEGPRLFGLGELEQQGARRAGGVGLHAFRNNDLARGREQAYCHRNMQGWFLSRRILQQFDAGRRIRL